MFNEDRVIEEIAERLLADFTLEEILEFNDLTELELMTRLISIGLINEPERYFEG